MNNLPSVVAKLFFVIGVLASAGFVVAVVVRYGREGDWPTNYLSAAMMILLVLMIGLKRRARREQTK